MFQCIPNGSTNSLRFAIVLGYLSISNTRFEGGSIAMDGGGGGMVRRNNLIDVLLENVRMDGMDVWIYGSISDSLKATFPNSIIF